jgi:WD40 repeat protein
MSYLAVARANGLELRIYSVVTQKCLAILHPHRRRMTIHGFSTDGSRLITSTEDCVAVFDLTSMIAGRGKFPVKIDSDYSAENFYTRGSRPVESAIVTTQSLNSRLAVRTDQSVALFDLSSRNLLWCVSEPHWPSESIYFARNEELIVTTSLDPQCDPYRIGNRYDTKLCVLDSRTGTVLLNIPVPGAFSKDTRIDDMALHPTEPIVAAAINNAIRVFHVSPEFTNVCDTVQYNLQHDCSYGRADLVRFTQCGTLLISVERTPYDSNIYIWETGTWTSICTIRHKGPVDCVSYNGDTKQIACCHKQGTHARIFDPYSGQLIKKVKCEGSLSYSSANMVILM